MGVSVQAWLNILFLQPRSECAIFAEVLKATIDFILRNERFVLVAAAVKGIVLIAYTCGRVKHRYDGHGQLEAAAAKKRAVYLVKQRHVREGVGVVVADYDDLH